MNCKALSDDCQLNGNEIDWRLIFAQWGPPAFQTKQIIFWMCGFGDCNDVCFNFWDSRLTCEFWQSHGVGRKCQHPAAQGPTGVMTKVHGAISIRQTVWLLTCPQNLLRLCTLLKITPYYDSLICKLICKGRNRTEAIQRTMRSLNEFVLDGVTTTIDLHKKILSHEKFISSDFDTNWLAKEKFY